MIITSEISASPLRIFGGKESRFMIVTAASANAAIIKIMEDVIEFMLSYQPLIVNYALHSFVIPREVRS